MNEITFMCSAKTAYANIGLTPVALADNEVFSPRDLRIIRNEVVANLETILEAGMSIVVSAEPRLQTVFVTDDLISACLTDGRTITVPPAWSWRLSDATPAQRQHFEIIGNGTGIHWPDVDKDVSVQGMLHGVPAKRPH
jgi:hypothetical protein